MANNNAVYQQLHTVSIPRKGLMGLAKSDELDAIDYKIILMLFTQLDGYNSKMDNPSNKRFNDPRNFKKIDIDQISDTLGIKKKEIKKRIKSLYDMKFDFDINGERQYLLDKGSNESIKDGYRFTF